MLSQYNTKFPFSHYGKPTIHSGAGVAGAGVVFFGGDCEDYMDYGGLWKLNAGGQAVSGSGFTGLTDSQDLVR
ncbi:MAG: hypothetical protein Kow0027_28770 [Saprospiraceae bacterium]